MSPLAGTRTSPCSRWIGLLVDARRGPGRSPGANERGRRGRGHDSPCRRAPRSQSPPAAPPEGQVDAVVRSRELAQARKSQSARAARPLRTVAPCGQYSSEASGADRSDMRFPHGAEWLHPQRAREPPRPLGGLTLVPHLGRRLHLRAISASLRAGDGMGERLLAVTCFRGASAAGRPRVWSGVATTRRRSRHLVNIFRTSRTASRRGRWKVPLREVVDVARATMFSS